MQCATCRHDNRHTAKFCEECGQRLRVRCAGCGFEAIPSAKFCPECGQRLGDSAPSPVVKPSFTAPQSSMPPHLIEKILTSKGALEGERKQVTVLFADLKGSMELLADRDPEEARQLLDPVLERMMTAVHRFEGTVNQVMGDGIMALFGAPITHEDHAVRACYAALAMQASVHQYAAEMQRTQGVPIQIRVGLNAGEVVVRSIGSDLRMDYTAVGQTTHLAARMEQMAMPGSILITPQLLALVEGYVQVKPLGSAAIKGLSTPMAVYEMTGMGPVRTRLQAATVRGLSRFVGRQAELDQLHQALERAAGGHGQVVALVGEPGVGKSRLVYELTHSHRTHGWLLLESHAVSYGKATAYLPMIDLLKGYCRIEDRDDLRSIRAKVTGQVLTLDEALQETLPALLSLLEALQADSGFHSLEPPQRRQRILEALKRLLLRESQTQPLLLVFDDLHWIDAETQAFLDNLVESLPTVRLLLLVTYRPEYQHGWGSKTYYTQLRLDSLPPANAQELLEALLGSDAGLQPLKQLLIERTEGNPFFLEESVRTLVETGALSGEQGAYRPVQTFPSLQVPATVQAVLAARIDRLPPDVKRLLQTAAVIGTEVPFVLLQTIAEEPEEALRLGLTHLQAAEFLYETSFFPELAYTFKHALTHEVAYGSLLHERRRALHARLVEAIETRASERLADHLERLAHHAIRGEVWDKAVAYFRQAGARAVAHSAHRQAVACFEQALGALRHLPTSRDRQEQGIDLRFDLRNALDPLGELRQILDYLGEAESLAEVLNDQRRLGRVSGYRGDYFRLLGDHAQAIESGHRALAIAAHLGDFALQVQANVFLGQVYLALGNYRPAIDFFKQIVTSLEAEMHRERFGLAALPAVVSRAYLALCLAEIGAFAEGITHADEAIRMAEASDHPSSVIYAHVGAGGLYLRQGDLPRAIPVLERGLGLCQSASLPFLFPLVASLLGSAYVLSTRLAEGLPLLEQAVEQAASTGRRVGHSLRVANLSEALLLAGRLEDAMQLAGHALELARAAKERGHEAWILRFLADIHAHRDPPAFEPAETLYRQARALADELGARPLVVHCHLGLATLHAKSGRREQSHGELSTAIALYQAMRMTFWLSRAEAVLAQMG